MASSSKFERIKSALTLPKLREYLKLGPGDPEERCNMSGILISPDRDKGDAPWPNFTYVEQPFPSPWWDKAKSLPLARSLGMPLKIFPWNLDKKIDLHNQLAEVLSLEVDHDTPTEEIVKRGYQGFKSTAMVDAAILMREDKEVLTSKHVEVLISYLEKYEELIFMGRGRFYFVDEQQVMMTRHTYKEALTPEAFRQYWEEYKAEKVREGAVGWRSVECPVKFFGTLQEELPRRAPSRRASVAEKYSEMKEGVGQKFSEVKNKIKLSPKLSPLKPRDRG